MFTKKALKLKLHNLNMLARLIHKAKHRILIFPNNPRFNSAILKSAIVTASMSVLCGLSPMNDWVFIFMIVLSMVSSFFVSIKTSKAPETWTEEFDKRLLAYEPVDLALYKWLQESVKNTGSLNYDTLNEWILMEKSAINALLYPKSYEEPVENSHRHKPIRSSMKFIDRTF